MGLGLETWDVGCVDLGGRLQHRALEYGLRVVACFVLQRPYLWKLGSTQCKSKQKNPSPETSKPGT